MTPSTSQASPLDLEIQEITAKLASASGEERKALRAKLAAKLSEQSKAEEKAEKNAHKEEVEQELSHLFQTQLLPLLFLSPQISGSTARFIYARKSLDNYEMLKFPADLESFQSQINSLPMQLSCVKEMLRIYPSKKLEPERLEEVLKYILQSLRMARPDTHKDIPNCSNVASEPCLHHIPLVVEEGPTPCWDQFLARVDLQDEFLAFLWSVFFVHDRGRQLLWVRDAGGGGKTAVAKTLAAWLGSACGTFDATTLSNNHGAEGRIGKRLLIDSDSKMYGAVVHEEVHKITGGDNITINPKGKKMYTANAYAKVIIMSNYFPKISSSVKNERSRLLMIKLAPRTEDTSVGIDLVWEQGLIDEKRHLLFKAKEAYDRVSKHHEIDSSRVNWDEIESNDLEDFYEFLTRKEIVFHPMVRIAKKEVIPAFIMSLRPKPNKIAETAIVSKIERHLADKKILVKKEGQGNAITWHGIGYKKDIPQDGDLLVENDINEKNI